MSKEAHLIVCVIHSHNDECGTHHMEFPGLTTSFFRWITVTNNNTLKRLKS